MAEKKEEKKGFTKTDMERVALFQEMGYTTVGDTYTVSQAEFNASASKGRQMMTGGGAKQKSALQAGYFTDKFSRVMEGEAYSDQVKMRRQHRAEEAKRNIGKQFVPASGEKKLSGLGSYYGSLSGPVPALSPQLRDGAAYKMPKKNFYTNPGKKGTGYGYVPVTFSKYQEYSSENYDQYKELAKRDNAAHTAAMKGGAFRLNMAPRPYFDDNPYKSDRPPAPPSDTPTGGKAAQVPKPFKPSSPTKRDGGMKAGTFDPYPAHSADEYKIIRNVGGMGSTSKGGGKVFIPPAGLKSAPVNSVLSQNVTRSVNAQNYKSVQSVMAY